MLALWMNTKEIENSLYTYTRAGEITGRGSRNHKRWESGLDMMRQTDITK